MPQLWPSFPQGKSMQAWPPIALVWQISPHNEAWFYRWVSAYHTIASRGSITIRHNRDIFYVSVIWNITDLLFSTTGEQATYSQTFKSSFCLLTCANNSKELSSTLAANYLTEGAGKRTVPLGLRAQHVMFSLGCFCVMWRVMFWISVIPAPMCGPELNQECSSWETGDLDFTPCHFPDLKWHCVAQLWEYNMLLISTCAAPSGANSSSEAISSWENGAGETV